VLPGTPQEIPGYFRVSMTASEEMITLALPKFQAAIEHAVTKINGIQAPPFQGGFSFWIILIKRAVDSSMLVEWKQGGDASVCANLRVQT
jgi:hypothetical protein